MLKLPSFSPKLKTPSHFIFIAFFPLIFLTFIWLTLPAAPTVHAMPCVGTNVTGTVFRDYNGDGAEDALEPGVIDVIVTAYDAAGTVVDMCNTDSDGDYGLTIPGASYPVRIEFTDYPSTLQPGPAGTDSETTVTFVSGDSTEIDVGLASPPEHCETDPELITNCFVFDNQIAGPHSGDPVLISFPYNSGTTIDTSDEALLTVPTTHDVAIPASDMGTTWGLAYNKYTDEVYAAAFGKRHSGYGPNGPGAIYAINRDTSTVSLFFDLNSTGTFSTGLDLHSSNWNLDYLMWDAVGKTAFGDIDISEDGETLWVINQWDRRLYEISIPSASVINAINLPNSADTNCVYNGGYTPPATTVIPPSTVPTADRDLVPGALKVVGDLVYIGLTCTAESTGVASNLAAYVYEYDGLSFTEVVNIPLTYDRTVTASPCPGAGSNCNFTWRPWSSTIISDTSPFDGRHYPQPWLMDIEFDEDNFMILGLLDRFGHQSGNDNNSVGTVEGRQQGDILRLEPLGNGTWQLESGATSGGTTTAGTTHPDNLGPGGGEYYYRDRYSQVMSEISSAGLAAQLGKGHLISSVSDPASATGTTAIRTGGIIWLNHADGGRARSYQVFNRDDPGTFGKASGIGDVELMCEVAPIEIGNRVWQDTNGDGVQDPGENGISGVVVGLYDLNGILVATQTTDANGSYYFDASIDIQRNMTYTVGILDTNFTSGNSLDGFGVSPTDANPGGLTNEDVRDSDGTVAAAGSGANTTNWGITFVTGDAGTNNHTFDFGFVPNADWGDAPDPGYPTLFSGINHANHALTLAGPRLGDCVDSETDGQPDATAIGDDIGGSATTIGICAVAGDDEDGVTFPVTPFTPGDLAAPVNIDMIASPANCLLNAWIDFNGDGDWGDAGEQIFTDEPLTAGVVHSLTFVVPGTATPSIFTSARFRCNINGGLTPNVPAPDGEVEDYQVELSAATDLGDAPDVTMGTGYPTLLASGGAVHTLVLANNPFLGAIVDAEPDGQPSFNADDDDFFDGLDDEDGVLFPLGGLAPGTTVCPTITVNATSILDAFIDFDRSGVWGDLVGEVIYPGGLNFPGAGTYDGATTPSTCFAVPTAPPSLLGPTYARFRLSTGGGLGPSGTASDGEVEDYLISIGLLDWGDAPDAPGYPTLASNAGAYHVLDGVTFLGALVDDEFNGQPNIAATGDDALDGSDDEDGVVFTTAIVPNSTACVDVTASPLPGGGLLDAWIDFDGSGIWGDGVGEQIATGLPLTPSGVTTHCFPVPPAATIGTTYARFRVSIGGGLAPTGPAPNGEVEDYAVAIDTAALDFGDLPDGYSTLIGSNGPRHVISGPNLGTVIDPEPNGQPSTNADGDDIVVSVDEDGITRADSNWSDGTGGINVTVTGGRACLSGWLDYWDGVVGGADGDFNDSGEQILNNVPVDSALPQPIFFNIPLPVGVANNATFYARFRLVDDLDDDGDCTDQTAVTPTGPASSGEVEDYRWNFDPTAVTLKQVTGGPTAATTPWVLLILLAFAVITLLTIFRLRRRPG